MQPRWAALLLYPEKKRKHTEQACLLKPQPFHLDEIIYLLLLGLHVFLKPQVLNDTLPSFLEHCYCLPIFYSPMQLYMNYILSLWVVVDFTTANNTVVFEK